MPSPDSYEVPPYGSDESRLLGWCLQAQLEGAAWLSAQQPSTAWAADLQMLSAPDGANPGPGGSNVGYNKAKRIARELVASLSQFRHEGEVKPAWDQDLYDQAHQLTNLDENWYEQCDIVARIREALQYAVGMGTGYLWETWDPHFWGPGKGDIALKAVSPANVSFVQLPADHDIQRAYATIVKEEMPLNLARAVYTPQNAAFAASLVPDRDSPGWLARGWQKVQKFLSPMLRAAGTGRPDRRDTLGAYPTVDIFHMYVNDSSINESPWEVEMGVWRDGVAADGVTPTRVPVTNWSYKVPALGDPIPTDKINPQTNQPFTRPAQREDCRLFPRRRLIIFSRTGVGYDGPASAWHGCTPVARIRFNDWAWEALGSSLVGETRTMQDGIIALMRLIEDSAAARLDPPMLYDETKVDAAWAQTFNPRRAGARSSVDLSQGSDIIQYPVPPEFYNVPPWILEYIREQESRMDYTAGTVDVTAITKAQQVPGADTQEKLLEMAGPIVQDLIRAIEVPLRQLGKWRIAYYFQYYTTARMLTITGPEGVPLDVQYYPDDLFRRSFLISNADGTVTRVPETNSELQLRIGFDTPAERQQRQLRSIDQFRYCVTESGINAIHRMTQKLFYTQLMKLGFPISWWTFAKIAQIPNFGPPPKGTNTEMERFQAQKTIEVEWQVMLAARAQQAAAALGLAPAGPVEGQGGPGGGAPGNGPGGEGAPDGGQPGAGREPSFHDSPQLKQRTDGSSTITTSR